MKKEVQLGGEGRGVKNRKIKMKIPSPVKYKPKYLSNNNENKREGW